MMKQGQAFKDGGKFSSMFSVRIRWYIWRLKSKDSDVREAAEEALGKEGIGYLELEGEKLLNYLVVLHLRCF